MGSFGAEVVFSRFLEISNSQTILRGGQPVIGARLEKGIHERQ